MAMRRGTARRPVAVTRPRLTWRSFLVEGFTLAGGVTFVMSLSEAGVSPLLSDLGVVGDYTIRRVRWTLGLRNIDLTFTRRIVTVYWGMTVVGRDAFGSGSGAVGDPRQDANDWFGYGTVMYATDVTLVEPSVLLESRDIDVRSMRKVNENNSLPVLVLSVVAGETALFNIAGRLLVSHGRQ